MKRIGANLRIFWEGTVLSYIALFHWLRPSTYLASKVIMPLAQLLFFTFIGSFASGKANVSFYVIGNAMQVAAVSGIYGVTMSIGGDRWEGTLPYLFGTPANRFVLFFGRAFLHLLDGMLGVIIAFAWGALLFGLDLVHTNVALLALAIVVTTASTSGLGLLMGCIGLITRNVMFVNNAVYFMLLIFSGANIPLDSLPGWMHAIANWLPLTHGILAARAIVAGSASANVLALLLRELGVGVLYMALGFVIFRWFETAAKRRGTLETA